MQTHDLQIQFEFSAIITLNIVIYWTKLDSDTIEFCTKFKKNDFLLNLTNML